MRQADIRTTIYEADRIIYIQDLNLGNVSVTNDAEQVIPRVHRETGKNLNDFIVIYEDSEGEIDELITKDNEFIDFGYLDAIDYEGAREILKPRIEKLKNHAV